jgi:CspA family cold shock protein
MSDIKIGKLRSFIEKNAYGFLRAEDGSGDTFVHLTELEKAGVEDFSVGQKMKYKICINSKTEKTFATELELLSDEQ